MRTGSLWFASCALMAGCGGSVVERTAEEGPGSGYGGATHVGQPEAGTRAALTPVRPDLDASVAAVGPRPADVGSPCAASYQCPGPSSAVTASGTLRGGPFSVTRAAVEYEHGFTNSTLLSFQAVWGTEPATLLVTLRSCSNGVPDAQVPPGVYASPSGSATGETCAPVAFVSLATCTGVTDLSDVMVEIDEHSGHPFEGTAVRLRGKFEISAAEDSALSIPFDIDAVCALHNST